MKKILIAASYNTFANEFQATIQKGQVDIFVSAKTPDRLIERVKEETGVEMDYNATIGVNGKFSLPEENDLTLSQI